MLAEEGGVEEEAVAVGMAEVWADMVEAGGVGT